MNDNSISNRTLIPEGINTCTTLLTNTRILLILSASGFNAFSLGKKSAPGLNEFASQTIK